MKSVDNVGVTFVNALVGRGLMNGVVNLQFATYLFTPAETMIDPDLAVSSRMRMDLECAKQLHTALGELLQSVQQGGAEAAEEAGAEQLN